MKRAQAALEFLMTYGWAILVVLVVIGALAYFGVLNPSILLPEKCTLETGMNCRDFRISSADKSVTLRLENGKGKGIVITNLSISGEIISPGCYADMVWFNNTVSGACIADCSNCTSLANLNIAKLAGGAYYGCNPVDAYKTGMFNSKVGIHMANGESAQIKMTGFSDVHACTIEKFSGKTKGKITLVWYFDDSSPQFSHTMEGELLGKVES